MIFLYSRTETARAQRINDKVLRHNNITITSTPDLSKNGCHSKSKLPKLPQVIDKLLRRDHIYTQCYQDQIINNEETQQHKKCVVEEKFFKYYFLLLFLICFLTPVLITISLNFFISLAVRNTVHETISHHQWLSLSACVLMWGPSLIQLLLEKTFVLVQIQELSVFLFLLGHMHNLLRSVLHVLLFVHHDQTQGLRLAASHRPNLTTVRPVQLT